MTDYKDAVKLLGEKLIKNVFVATDSKATLEDVKNILYEHRVFSFADLPEENIPVHRQNITNQKRFQVNSDAILDLFMLGLSKDLHIFPISNGKPDRYSGYSALAKSLYDSWPLLRMALGRSQYF